METINVTVPADVPPEVFAPMNWQILSLWHRSQDVEQPVEIEERTDVLRPDGSMASSSTTRKTITNDHLMYRTIVNMPVFPIGQSGYVWVKCFTRQLNPETEWIVAAEFPLLVKHNPIPPAAEQPEQPAAEQPAAAAESTEAPN
jgi:hypothetical protein